MRLRLFLVLAGVALLGEFWRPAGRAYLRPRGWIIVALALCAIAAPRFSGAADDEPRPVSPGSQAGTRIAESCPTFSWSARAAARGYELVVHRIEKPTSATVEVLRHKIAGAALTWTPDLDRCLRPGARYGWSVRAHGAEGTGPWSEAALFEVSAPADEATPTQARPQDNSPQTAAGEARAERPSTPRPSPGLERGAGAAAGSSPATGERAQTAATASPPLSIVRSDPGFRVAEFLNRASSGNRTAVVELANGNAVPTTWRIGVGGVGNGLGLSAGEFYLERAGWGLALRTDGSILRLNGLPALFADFQSSEGPAGCGVICARSGLTNTVALLGENHGSNGRGVTGMASGANGMGVLGVVNAAGGAGVLGGSTHIGSPAGVFELSTLPGDLLVGRLQGSNVFRVDYSGKGFFNGGTQTSGADFAESMEVAGEVADYEPGDVMVIDAAGRRRLRLASERYSTAVAGIVSARPGVLATPHPMGAPELETEIPLAVVGIVPCKVSAENGPIRAGDLLVTSSTPGHAMLGTRQKRMLGAVVGKALEPFDRGTGVIEVLVLAR